MKSKTIDRTILELSSEYLTDDDFTTIQQKLSIQHDHNFKKYLRLVNYFNLFIVVSVILTNVMRFYPLVQNNLVILNCVYMYYFVNREWGVDSSIQEQSQKKWTKVALSICLWGLQIYWRTPLLLINPILGVCYFMIIYDGQDINNKINKLKRE